jgi:hypothetical protein
MRFGRLGVCHTHNLSALGFSCPLPSCRGRRAGGKTQMTRLHDLAGQRFGHLVVRERTPHRNKRDAYWLCECDCGGNKQASTHSLRRGDVASCGCLRISKSGKCTVKGCTTRARSKGLCFKHYHRARRHNGDTSDRPRITICTVEGCGGKVEAKGLCHKHYQRARRRDRKTSDRPRIMRTCRVEGCGGKAIKHGLCNKHYIRARKHNGDTSDRPRIIICTIEGCGGNVRTKGLCAKHYMRALRHGGDTCDRPRARNTDGRTGQKARQAAGPSARADAARPRSLARGSPDHRVLGLEIRPQLLARADEVIE